MATVLIILLVIGFALYINFLPSIIAFRRGHDNRVAILLVNLFLNWTFVGWIGALIWSLNGRKSEEKTVIINNHIVVQGHQSTMAAGAISYAPEPAMQILPPRGYVPVPAVAQSFGRRGR